MNQICIIILFRNWKWICFNLCTYQISPADSRLDRRSNRACLPHMLFASVVPLPRHQGPQGFGMKHLGAQFHSFMKRRGPEKHCMNESFFMLLRFPFDFSNPPRRQHRGVFDHQRTARYTAPLSFFSSVMIIIFILLDLGNI